MPVSASNSFHALMRSYGTSVIGNSIYRFCCSSFAAFDISDQAIKVNE
jgi:hypothetical protein